MSTPIWSPSQEQIEKANITKFMRAVNKKYHLQLQSYQQLHQWSVDNRANFWQEVINFCDLQFIDPPTAILNEVLREKDSILSAQWFSGGTLNYAANLLRHRDNRIALIGRNEKGERRQLTYVELYAEVSKLINALTQLDIKVGDRICGVMPNCIETVIAFLATSALGAIWSSCSPDFGINGILDRFGQIEPRVLFCCDGYFYNGKTVQTLEKISDVAKQIPSIEKIVVVPFAQQTDKSVFESKQILWQDFITTAPTEIDFIPTTANHPLYILYSSGTTGKPKCIVHSVGGTLVQHLKELVLHTDLTLDDRIFYFTTCGWMMWNWLMSSLAVGATVVLYDGSPMYPNTDAMFEIVEKEQVTVFGTSAKYIASLSKADYKPKEHHQLNQLRTVLSTGSPLTAEYFDYIYQAVKADLCLSSISGGTDIVSCFALGNPTLPVYRGEIQCPGLGMDVDFFDDEGNSAVGTRGELVCKRAFPSMPVGFWHDEAQQKYHAAYFERFDNYWAHGDFGMLTENGGIIIFGRSDAVLNPGGIRIGTAEIYRQVEKHAQVIDCVAVGQEWQDDERVILFVVLRENIALTAEIAAEIKQLIRANTTPRHVPAKIIQVREIPRTISGKVVELAVRDVIHGQAVKNTEALANPDALKLFENLEELKS